MEIFLLCLVSMKCPCVVSISLERMMLKWCKQQKDALISE